MLRRYFQTLHARTVKVSILSKPQCCLCDQAEFGLNRMLENLEPNIRSRITIERVNIENDVALENEYRLTIPVVLVDGEVAVESKIDPSLVRNAILDRFRDR